MHARDREEAFRIYLAILTQNRSMTVTSENKLDNVEAVHDYNKKCTRAAIHLQADFDREWRRVHEGYYVDASEEAEK